MDEEMKEAFQNAYMELGGLGERVLGKVERGEGGYSGKDLTVWPSGSKSQNTHFI